MLRETGWINFRMRAMLVSVAAYPLWLQWQPVGQWLARQFLDYEPGIHWSQMQMQSGTTGINIPRGTTRSSRRRTTTRVAFSFGAGCRRCAAYRTAGCLSLGACRQNCKPAVVYVLASRLLSRW